MSEPIQDPEILFDETPASTRVQLVSGERVLSHLSIIPFTIRIGRATVRMDGIGGVHTEEEFRRRGLSRRVLEASVTRMRAGDAALSMLYGIPGFYPKFGYATAGPDHFLALTHPAADTLLPEGWHARPFTTADLPAVRALYEANTASAVGAALRPRDGGVWTRLLAVARGLVPDECRVVTDPAGAVRACAWRGKGFWYVTQVEREQPGALVLAEVLADAPRAADAVLALCGRWAVEESARRPQPAHQVLIGAAPEGPVSAAAMRRHARLIRDYRPCGGSMARVLHVGRLLAALRPELEARLAAAGWREPATLRLETELGAGWIHVGAGGVVTVAGRGGQGPASGEERALSPQLSTLHVPPTDLARLALGAFPPGDLLDRLDAPVDESTRVLVELLFPLRHPHMHLPDRF